VINKPFDGDCWDAIRQHDLSEGIPTTHLGKRAKEFLDSEFRECGVKVDPDHRAAHAALGKEKQNDEGDPSGLQQSFRRGVRLHRCPDDLIEGGL